MSRVQVFKFQHVGSQVRSECARSVFARSAAVVIGLSLIFSLTGCGGANQNLLPTVVAAARTTVDHGGVWTLTLAGSAPFGQTRMTVFGQGAFVSNPLIGFEPIWRGTPGARVGRESLIFMRDRVYLRPAPGTTLPARKEWLVAVVKGGERPSPDVERFVEQAEGLNPQLLLDEMAWGASAVSRDGQLIVDYASLAR